MRDIFMAMADATKGGDILFAKNSDRPLGELQDVIALPAGGSRHWFTEGLFPCEQNYRQFDFF